jgi:glycerate-2-kinase
MLQNNIDPATVAVAMTVVDKVGEFVGAAVKWIDESSDKAADVERITAALTVVRDNRVTLVQYSEELLDKSIKALVLSAHQVYGAMQLVKSMAKIVKTKSVDTKEWMDSIAELDDP